MEQIKKQESIIEESGPRKALSRKVSNVNKVDFRGREESSKKLKGILKKSGNEEYMTRRESIKDLQNVHLTVPTSMSRSPKNKNKDLKGVVSKKELRKNEKFH